MKYTLDDDGRRRVNGELDFRPPEDSTLNNRTSQIRNTGSGRSSTPASSSHWRLKLVLVTLFIFVALAIFWIAHFYDKSNKSEEEEAIDSYMIQQNSPGYTGAQEDGMTMDNSVEDAYQDDASDMGYEDDLLAEDAAVSPDAGGVETVDMDSEYEMPGSDSRYLSEADIAGYDQAGIQLIVNEIYARHGRVFSHLENDSYFRSKSWYHPVEGKTDEQIVNEFNEYEIANGSAENGCKIRNS